MGAVLLQAGPSPAAAKAEAAESAGGSCTFDRTIAGKDQRLLPVLFLSRKTKGPEWHYHGYVGEAAAGIWAIEKLRPFLFGQEFTWITDCSGLKSFFEGDDLPTHMVQRWRLQLLRYNFTIVHRPQRMLAECDLLSRYNALADAAREGAALK